MGRVLITPKGAVLRGFSDEEEERALYLEKSIAETSSGEAFHPGPSSSRFATSVPSFSSLFAEGAFSLSERGYSSGVREPASGVPNLAFGPQDDVTAAAPTEEVDIDKRVDEVKAAWEASKKETDALGKRLEGLIKKNRRLFGF